MLLPFLSKPWCDIQVAKALREPVVSLKRVEQEPSAIADVKVLS